MSWQRALFRGICRLNRYATARFAVDDPAAWIRAQTRAHQVPWPARFPPEVQTRTATVAGVCCHWVTRRRGSTAGVLLYLHGGGGIFGWDAPYRYMLACLVGHVRMRALAVDYPLAPEFPFPAALNACIAVYQALITAGVTSSTLVIACDSFGGHLAGAVLLHARAAGLPLPRAVVMISPLLDLTFSGASSRTPDPLLTLPFLQGQVRMYAPTQNLRDPRVSPLFADLQGLPPLCIEVGEDELLRSDAVRFAGRARQAGVPVALTIWPGLFHGWHLFGPYLPEADQLLRKLAVYIRQSGRVR